MKNGDEFFIEIDLFGDDEVCNENVNLFYELSVFIDLLGGDDLFLF